MRTLFLCGVLWACLQATSFAQTIPAYDPATDSTNLAYQNQLNTIFEEVDLSQVPSGVLYEHGYPFIAIEAFTGSNSNKLNCRSM
jgi:hypothetical protein